MIHDGTSCKTRFGMVRYASVVEQPKAKHATPDLVHIHALVVRAVLHLVAIVLLQDCRVGADGLCGWSQGST